MGIFNLRPARKEPQPRTLEDKACAGTLARFRLILHAVRALHTEVEGRCAECDVEYPCRTMILLGAE